jgi:hypothetical protein
MIMQVLPNTDGLEELVKLPLLTLEAFAPKFI